MQSRSAKTQRYTVIGKIGEGAHGLVLKAYDNNSPVPKAVALKKILLKKIDDGIPVTVLREVKTLQLLKHPYVRIMIWSFFFLRIVLKSIIVRIFMSRNLLMFHGQFFVISCARS